MCIHTYACMYIHIHVYIYTSSVIGTFWLIISTRSEFSSPLHRSPTLSPTLCVFYIFDLLHPLFVHPAFPSPFSLLSLASGFLPRMFNVQIARDALRIRSLGIAREIFNVFIYFQSREFRMSTHARLIERRTRNLRSAARFSLPLSLIPLAPPILHLRSGLVIGTLANKTRMKRKAD